MQRALILCLLLVTATARAEDPSDKKRAAATEAKKKKYAGVGGDRFKLLVEYDVWRGSGCRVISDVEVLKKAPVLFQWLVNSDGTHTIRRYQLTGDKLVGTTNKTFRTETAASAGCK